MNMYVVGLPGVGKTYWGGRLASKLSMDFVDLDVYIEENSGRTIASIFKTEGENKFRKLEAEALRQVGSRGGQLVATGGGTPCFHDNLDFMKENGVTLYIKDNLAAIAGRLLADAAKRPLFGAKTLEETKLGLLNLLANRRQYYEQTHIITGIEAFEHIHLLTNRLELFTKTSTSLKDSH
jgi:shikimate kinase